MLRKGICWDLESRRCKLGRIFSNSSNSRKSSTPKNSRSRSRKL